jgi:DNA (cytosine-5)-methyltransferase 1
MLNVLDLFSGIGGFSLGLERAGMRTVAFCEIDPYCRAVLRKHWPGMPVFDDVRGLGGAGLHMLDICPDVICGGFPCQDISLAGKGAGLYGERSGLWWEFHRLIKEIRPQYAIIENVAALRSRGLDTVLGSLAALRYDAEWHCVPASAVGAPHRRDRIWIIAYPQREQLRIESGRCGGESGTSEAFAAEHGADRDVADSRRSLLRGRGTEKSTWWQSEPDVGRVAHGIPSRVDRLRALGNAVVPQIPEMIGRAIMTDYIAKTAT